MRLTPLRPQNVHKILTSNAAYNKIFEYEFDRARHAVFNVNYGKVFDHAQIEADISIQNDIRIKVSNASKSERKQAYEELGSEDSDASDDDFDRVVKRLGKKALIFLRASPEYEETFRASIHFTFENTLFSAMSKTYSNVFNSMLNGELEKANESVKNMV